MAVTTVRAAQVRDELTDADIAAANKDGVAATPSLRTLGTGAQQAAAGNHTHAYSTLTGATQGSVIFAGASGLTQDNANLFYDAANVRLGIGAAAAPAATLDVQTNTGGVLLANVGPVGGGAYAPYVYQGATSVDTYLCGGYGTNSDTAGLKLNYAGYQGGVTKYRSTAVYDGKGSVIGTFVGAAARALKLDDSAVLQVGASALQIAGSGAAPGGNSLVVSCNDTLTANRALSLSLGDAPRSLVVHRDGCLYPNPVLAQTGHGFAAGDWLYLNGATYAKARADAALTCEAVGVVAKVVTANSFVLATPGAWVSGLSGLTAGATYCLSSATAGAVTATEPTGPAVYSKPCLLADSATSGYVMIGRTATNLYTDPTASGPSTWRNQGAATTATANRVINITNAASGAAGLNVLEKTAPATPYTITVALAGLATSNATGFPLWGVGFVENATGKMVVVAVVPVTFFIASTAQGYLLQVRRQTTATTLSTAPYTNSNGIIGGPAHWLRMTYDGTTMSFLISADGVTFKTFYSEAKAAFLTTAPDRVCAFVSQNTATGGTTVASVDLLSWKEE